jgi:hypothetical protein
MNTTAIMDFALPSCLPAASFILGARETSLRKQRKALKRYQQYSLQTT